MSLFEYLTVAVSIVLGLSMVRLVHGLRVASGANRYWVHLLYTALLIVVHLQFWWAMWSYHENVDWNFARFVFVFLGPMLLYSLASTLIPDAPNAVTSWREHYYGVLRPFFLVWLGFLVHQALAPTLVGGALFVPRILPLMVFSFVVCALGAFSKSERVHTVLAVAIVLALLASIVIGFGIAVRA